MGTTHAAEKKSARNEAAPVRQQNDTQLAPEAIPETQMGFPDNQFLLQRKGNACACGGTCPKCHTETAIQPKLKIGAPNDKYEQEADRVAEQIVHPKGHQHPLSGMSPFQLHISDSKGQHQSIRDKKNHIRTEPLGIAITPLVQRQEEAEDEVEDSGADLIQAKPLEIQSDLPIQLKKSKSHHIAENNQATPINRIVTHYVQCQQENDNKIDEREEDQEELQTEPTGGILQRQSGSKYEKEDILQKKSTLGQAPYLSSNTQAKIQSIKGNGTPLPQSIRSFFEFRMGYDFSNVRIHTGNNAANAAQSVNARAFTLGKDIVFNAGEFSPDTISGKYLLAHELTHVVQQNSGVINRVQREIEPDFQKPVPIQHFGEAPSTIMRDTPAGELSVEDMELLNELGIDTRSFDEVWEEFDRLRNPFIAGEDRSEQALALVPTLLAKMGTDDAVEHAGDLAFWLLDRDQTALAEQALSKLEGGWWIRYISASGPGVPNQSVVTFGAAVGPGALIERAEQSARAGNHTEAKRMLAMAHLFLEMQWEQALEERARLIGVGSDILENTPVGILMRMEREEIWTQRMRVLNVYPRLSTEALEAGDFEQAQHLAAISQELITAIHERSLAPIEVFGMPPPQLDPVTEPVSGIGRGSHPSGSGPIIPEVEREEDVPDASEAEEEEAPAPRPRAATQIINSPAQFDGALIIQHLGLRFWFVGSEQHAITGSIGAAVNIARILFGVSGAVIAQRSGDPLTFVVAGITPNFSLTEIRTWTIEGRPDLIGASGTIFERLGDDRNHFVRAVVTKEAIFAPGGELEDINSAAVLENLLGEIEADELAGRSFIPRDLVQENVFSPIEELIESGDSDDLESAADRLEGLNANAFSALEWEQRAQLLQALMNAGLNAARRETVIEILKTIESESRLRAVIEQLREADLWDELIEDLNGKVWSFLAVVGRRFGNPGPITIDRVTTFLLEARLLRPVPGIVIGPDGPEISISALTEIEAAADTFIDFLGNTLDAIVMLITAPDKIVEGLAQLVKMIVMWNLADLGYLPAIEFRQRILSQVGEQIIFALRGVEVLAERTPQLIAQVKWTLIWEIASLFVGVGEIRAVLRGVELGRASAAIARFLRILGLAGRLAESEAVVSNLSKLARILSRSSRVLNREDDIIRLLGHLPEEDALRLGRALEGVDIDDTVDLTRLISSNPALGEVAQRSLREIEPLGILAQKAGGLSDEVVRGIRQLRGREIPADEVADLVRLVPDEEGARFAQALRSFEGIDAVPNSAIRALAESPNRMNALRAFGGELYLRAFRRSSGDASTLDGFLTALSNRRATMDPTEFQTLLDELAAGNTRTWRRFLAPENALRQQADSVTHGLLTGGSRPYTWNPTTNRYTRPGHGGTTEIVEIYGDGRVRFWREHPDGTLTDEVVQYNITLHGLQPRPSGSTTLQSNHGIQDAWVDEHFSGLIDSDDVPTVMLTDSRTGSEHRTITTLQNAERDARLADPNRTGKWDATYWEMRDALIRHHEAANVPPDVIARLVAESDRIFLPFRNHPQVAHLFPPLTP